MVKKKSISIFLGIITSFHVSIGVTPYISAEVFENVSENKPPENKSEAERIEEFQEFFNRCLSEKIPAEEVIKICDDAAEVMKEDAMLINIDGDVIVVGDTHSDVGAAAFGLEKFINAIKEGKKVSLLCLGDYVDRGNEAPGGPNGIKNVMLLLKLKTLFSDKVVLLRGNHEDNCMGEYYGFLDECKKIYGMNEGEFTPDQPKMVFDKINETFNYLSLVAVLNKKVVCVHGGLSLEWKSLSQISELQKPFSAEDCFGNSLLTNSILWADPSKKVKMWAINEARGGDSYIFGEEAANEFFQTNDLECLIRAHEMVPNGVGYPFGEENKSVITVFSAPNYESQGNDGAILQVNQDGSTIIDKIIYNPDLLEKLK